MNSKTASHIEPVASPFKLSNSPEVKLPLTKTERQLHLESHGRGTMAMKPAREEKEALEDQESQDELEDDQEEQQDDEDEDQEAQDDEDEDHEPPDDEDEDQESQASEQEQD